MRLWVGVLSFRGVGFPAPLSSHRGAAFMCPVQLPSSMSVTSLGETSHRLTSLWRRTRRFGPGWHRGLQSSASYTRRSCDSSWSDLWGSAARAFVLEDARVLESAWHLSVTVESMRRGVQELIMRRPLPTDGELEAQPARAGRWVQLVGELFSAADVTDAEAAELVRLFPRTAPTHTEWLGPWCTSWSLLHRGHWTKPSRTLLALGRSC